MFNLPSQFGRAFRIAPSVTAHTRTIFSQRMKPARQRLLAEAVTIAKCSLNYAITQATLNSNALIHTEGPAPKRSGNGTFNDEFIRRFNVNVSQAWEYKNLLTLFKCICSGVLNGLLQPLPLVDINLADQNTDLHGYVTAYTNGRYGRIHIDFEIIKPHNEYYVARSLIHEASHKFMHTRDYCYFDNGAMNRTQLPTTQLLNNADSIAEIVSNTYLYHLK